MAFSIPFEDRRNWSCTDICKACKSFVCVRGIPYRYQLFEPKLLLFMMSFIPFKEYFQDLQLAIAVSEDLNLNRRIWQ